MCVFPLFLRGLYESFWSFGISSKNHMNGQRKVGWCFEVFAFLGFNIQNSLVRVSMTLGSIQVIIHPLQYIRNHHHAFSIIQSPQRNNFSPSSSKVRGTKSVSDPVNNPSIPRLIIIIPDLILRELIPKILMTLLPPLRHRPLHSLNSHPISIPLFIQCIRSIRKLAIWEKFNIPHIPSLALLLHPRTRALLHSELFRLRDPHRSNI
jgi:hypothetical protein